MNEIKPIVVGPRELVVVAPQKSLRIGPATAVSQAQQIIVRPTATTIISPEARSRQTVAPLPAVAVIPPQRGAWDERGWVWSLANGEQIYEGRYQVLERRTRQQLLFDGRISMRNGDVKIFIADPPPQVKKHPKSPCLRIYGNGPWFQLHWRRAAHNVDDAILYMERVLDESINR